jgi:hypothetical protein
MPPPPMDGKEECKEGIGREGIVVPYIGEVG